MDEIIKQYLKENLKISIDNECRAYDGEFLVVKLLLDDEVIDRDSLRLKTFYD